MKSATEKVKEPLFGLLKGSVTVKVDIIAPIDENWDAQASADC